MAGQYCYLGLALLAGVHDTGSGRVFPGEPAANRNRSCRWREVVRVIAVVKTSDFDSWMPNKRDEVNPAMGSRGHTGRRWDGVTDPGQ